MALWEKFFAKTRTFEGEGFPSPETSAGRRHRWPNMDVRFVTTFMTQPLETPKMA
jgi:hypothetical protein